MAKQWIAGAAAVVLLGGCRVPPRTVTEGTAVAAARLPKRQVEVPVELDDGEAIADGLDLYLAATPPRSMSLPRLRSRLSAALARRLGGSPGDDTLRDIFESALVLIRRPEPVSGETADIALLGAPGTLPKELRGLLLRLARLVLDRFEPRGEVGWSLLGHAVAAYLGQDAESHAKRFAEILEWLAATRAQKGDEARFSTVLSQLEKTAGKFPSPLVLSELRRWSRRAFSVRDLPDLEPSLVCAAPPLLRGDPAAALAAVSARRRPDKVLERLLKRVVAKDAVAADYDALAAFYREDLPRVSEMVCRLAAVRFPKSALPWSCLGDLARKDGFVLRAMADYERALRLSSDWRTVYNKLAMVYMSRLAKLLERQDFRRADRLIALSIAFHKAASTRWPASPLDVDMASVYYATGQARAFRGDMAGAEQAYGASLKYRRRGDALVELGNIAFWRAKYRKALEYYKQALESVPDDGRRIYWLSRVALPMALCHRRLGNRRQARFVLVKAAGSILRLSTLLKDKTLRAGLLVSAAEIVDELGRRDHALRLLDIAVDTTHDIETIYPRVMTFYVSRGLVDQALDTYTRATTKQVAEYHRAYSTFWVLNLGRRCKVEPVRLSAAKAGLDAFHGHHWYDRLAAWMRGELTDTQVAKYAKRPGDRLELTYYRAMKYLSSGRVEDARRLWHAIKRTNMYVYFEYQMADWYLRHGAPCSNEGQGRSGSIRVPLSAGGK